jgi:hypothetical protein
MSGKRLRENETVEVSKDVLGVAKSGKPLKMSPEMSDLIASTETLVTALSDRNDEEIAEKIKEAKFQKVSNKTIEDVASCFTNAKQDHVKKLQSKIAEIKEHKEQFETNVSMDNFAKLMRDSLCEENVDAWTLYLENLSLQLQFVKLQKIKTPNLRLADVFILAYEMKRQEDQSVITGGLSQELDALPRAHAQNPNYAVAEPVIEGEYDVEDPEDEGL